MKTPDIKKVVPFLIILSALEYLTQLFTTGLEVLFR